MTLSELLEELKGIDPETYEALRNYPIYCCSDDEDITVNLLASRNHVLIADALQGCIQRACERRGWTLTLEYVPWYSPMRRWHAYISTGPRSCDTKDTASDSAAEALLAAYIAVVREEKK